MDLKIIEKYLNDSTESRKSEFLKYESLPEHKINNKAFLRNKEDYKSYLVHLTKILGFDCRPSTPLVLYKTSGYISVSKEKYEHWNKSYKNRKILRHYGSHLNRSRYIKIKKNNPIHIVDKHGEIKKTIEPKKQYRFEYHEALTNFYRENCNSIMTPEQKTWAKKTIVCGILKFNNLALREYPNSEIIAMDIDTHGGEIISKKSIRPISDYKEFSLKVLNELKQLPLNILLFERSKVGSGIHVYIKLENIHNKEVIKQSLKKILEYKFPVKVEFRTKNKSLRLPFTYDYEFVNMDTFKTENKIKRKIGLILEKYKSPTPTGNVELTKLLDKKVYEFDPPERIEHPPTSIFKRGKLKLDAKFIESKFKITEGNRIGGDAVLWDVVYYSLRVGYNLEQFIDLVKRSNVSSKDLTKWDESKLRKELESIYKYSESKFNPNYKPKYGSYPSSQNNTTGENKGLISNLKFLNKVQSSNINYVIDSILYKKLNSEGDSKWLRSTIDDCRLIFPELMGKILFENLNPREINSDTRKKFRLTREKVEDLKVGHQFPKEYLSLLKGRYPSVRRNMKYLFSIFKNEFLQTYVHQSNGKTTYVPALKSSSQFTLAPCTLIYLGDSINSLLFKKQSSINNTIQNSKNIKHTILCDGVFGKSASKKPLNYMRDW